MEKLFFYYDDNTFEKLEKLTKIYVDSVHEIESNSDVENLDKEDRKRLERYFQLDYELQPLSIEGIQD